MGNTVGSQRKISKRQEAILIGMLLGDACLEKGWKNARLRVEHGLKQKDYLIWKFKELQGLVAAKPRLVNGTIHLRTGKSYKRWHFSTFSIPELNAYWHKFYSREGKKIPKSILALLKSPLSLAVWFMDDGYKRSDCNALRINTDCFKFKEQKLLQECLENNFGISVKIHKKGKFWNLYIPNPEVERFCRMVKPFILPQMRYKISLTP